MTLAGALAVPEAPRGIVLFAHGSGSGRLSPRNRAVAGALNGAGYATLLFDLLTDAEELERENVFYIALLGSRLLAATRWVEDDPHLRELPLGYFGASTGAAAALTAAAEIPERVGAIVSRGGRPDLALDLGAVRTPTLLIVGAPTTGCSSSTAWRNNSWPLPAASRSCPERHTSSKSPERSSRWRDWRASRSTCISPRARERRLARRRRAGLRRVHLRAVAFGAVARGGGAAMVVLPDGTDGARIYVQERVLRSRRPAIMSTDQAMARTRVDAVLGFLQGAQVEYELFEHQPVMSAAAGAGASQRCMRSCRKDDHPAGRPRVRDRGDPRVAPARHAQAARRARRHAAAAACRRA